MNAPNPDGVPNFATGGYIPESERATDEVPPPMTRCLYASAEFLASRTSHTEWSTPHEEESEKPRQMSWGYAGSKTGPGHTSPMSWNSRTFLDRARFTEAPWRKDMASTPEPVYYRQEVMYIGLAADGPYAGQELQSSTLTRFGYAKPEDEEPIGRYDFDTSRNVWVWHPYHSTPE